MEESLDSSGDEDKLEGTETGLIAILLYKFEKQNCQRKQHFTTSTFLKE